MGTVVDDAAAAEFHAFFERHYAELSRLARLLTGEPDAADDLAADAPAGPVAPLGPGPRGRPSGGLRARCRLNLARTRVRTAVRERRRVALF